jgi:hypothetical protein
MDGRWFIERIIYLIDDDVFRDNRTVSFGILCFVFGDRRRLLAWTVRIVELLKAGAAWVIYRGR